MNRIVSESKMSAFGTDDIFVLLAICRKMRPYLRREPTPQGKGRAEVQQKLHICK